MADLSDQPAFETGGLATCPTAPDAGNQGLGPCKAGFGDQLAPCALPIRGPGVTRTRHLLRAKQALSQVSYSPICHFSTDLLISCVPL